MRVLPPYVKAFGGNLENRGGAMWFEAPAPPLVHRHYAWTRGWVGLYSMHRCPCGAVADDRLRWSLLDRQRVGRPWMSRRRQRAIIAQASAKNEQRESWRAAR